MALQNIRVTHLNSHLKRELCNKDGFPKISCCTGLPTNSTCPVGPVMGGFSYVLVLRAMEQMAQVVGDRSACNRYSELAAKATTDFHTIFWSPDFHAYGGDYGATQSLSLPALWINATPPPLVETVLASLQTVSGCAPCAPTL